MKFKELEMNIEEINLEKINEKYIQDMLQGICQDCVYFNKIKPIINKMLVEVFITVAYKCGLKMADLEQEIDRLNNIINECMESVDCIEHNLEKYEEVGLDHFDYALEKTRELKQYLYEELKEENK